MLRAFLWFSAIAVLLAACSAAGQTVLNEKSAGTTVTLQKGSRLQVKLEGNPTTGYQWVVKDLDAAVLKQVGEAQHKPNSNLPGAPGVTTFTFEAVGPGAATLQLAYLRSWEKDKPPEKTWSVNVTVK
jgi:inhibitor of cysteine peptidase